MEANMRRSLLAAAAVTALVGATVHAALPEGTRAPDFTATATLAGKEFTFSLADALKKGPVVLYFYPAALHSRLRHRGARVRRGERKVPGAGRDRHRRVTR
jgi:hypothetical protein